MPEEIPEGAPYHPYDNPEAAEDLVFNKTYAKEFWSYVQHPEAEDGFDDPRYTLFPSAPTRMPKSELTPEKVVEAFDRYKAGLLRLRENEQYTRLPNGGAKLDEFNLYDVYLYGLWDTHRSAYYGELP